MTFSRPTTCTKDKGQRQPKINQAHNQKGLVSYSRHIPNRGWCGNL